jgi:hypothetical protein
MKLAKLIKNSIGGVILISLAVRKWTQAAIIAFERRSYRWADQL